MKKVCEVDGCKGCPLRNLFPDNTFVEPRLGTGLRLAIGEAPGAQEAEQGQPFVGGSGKWLKVIYNKAGVRDTDISVINTIQCRPLDNNFPTDPTARRYISDTDAHKAVHQCIENHVKPFLHSRPWKRIDTFGDKPLKFILEKNGGITNWRGSIVDVPGMDCLATPTFHPAYLARDQAMIPVAINDLRRSLEKEPERYNIYPTIEAVRNFKAKKFAFDLETNRWNNREIYMVGLSASPYEAMVVPFQGVYVEELKRIFAEAEEVIGQNLVQFDLPILELNGIRIRNVRECMVWDIMLMHHLRFPSFPHDLEFIGKQFTNKGAWKADKLSFETYCARDTDVTFRCFEPLHYLLEQANLLDIYKYISWPMGRICKSMTDAGVYVSGSHLQTIREEFLAKIVKEEHKLPPELRTVLVEKRKRIKAPEGTVNAKGKAVKYLYETYKEPVSPWRSSPIKIKFLYETLGLPEQRHIKTKQVTVDKGALDKLYHRYKLPELEALKNLNKYATLLSGFAKEDLQRQEVLHPSFNVHGTQTGRLSSSGPNFQNQPSSVRFMFVSRYSGGKILSIDYSGIENRLTAHLAQDRKRAEWLKDQDFSEHKFLASIMTDTPYEDIIKSKEKDSPYAIGKIVVHGSDRMMGAKKISEQFDLDFNEVKRWQALWKAQIADTVRWQQRISNDAQRVGWTQNRFGRRLWLWESNAATRAVSFHPQSNAFEVIARAMIGLMYEKIDWPLDWAKKVTPKCIPLPDDAILFVQVHDELVVDTPNEDVLNKTTNIMTEVMTQPWPELDMLSLPIGKGSGNSWGECE